MNTKHTDPAVITAATFAGLIGLGIVAFLRIRSVGGAKLREQAMRKMLASMPEDAPPRLVARILPELQKQNAQILTRLEAQSRLMEAALASRSTTDWDVEN